MKQFRLGALLTGLLALVLAAAPTPRAPIAAPSIEYQADDLDPSVLVGTWKVDLRPTPDAPEYFQKFEVRAVAGDSLVGTFYYSDVANGRINTAWGKVRFAFVTSDGSGKYNTSGTYEDGKLEGMTHATGRGFLSYWTATRVED